MQCQCCILLLSGKKYVVKCENCKNKQDLTETIKFRWYEKHIVLLRDNPEFRLIVELIMLFGYVGFIILIYMQLNNLTLISNEMINRIIAMIFIGWFGLVFGYIDACQKLKSDSKFYLKKNYNE